VVSLHSLYLQEIAMNLEFINRDFGFAENEILEINLEYRKKVEAFETKNKNGIILNRLLSEIAVYDTDYTDYTGNCVEIGRSDELTEDQKKDLREKMIEFWPWRKGPFRIFGIDIDTEWKSNLKWNRLKDHITPLNGRHVLDIGSSSGYYMFKMLEQSPELVIGIEPYINFFYQFRLLNGFAREERLITLPFRFEEMENFRKKFNTVFCMGILYHRKSPIEFLQKIRSSMAKNGELVIETLIIDGDSHTCLYPLERYAKMLNVYFIPTMPVLETWLARSGFKNIRCIDVSRTTTDEQKTSEWVKTESLPDFLDPNNSSLTIEGYQGPTRAILIAEA